VPTPRRDNLNVTVPDETIRVYVELRRLLADVQPLSLDGTDVYDRAYKQAAEINRTLKRFDTALAAYLEELARPAGPLKSHGGRVGHEGRPGQERPTGRQAL
jgi:hypothetical protein